MSRRKEPSSNARAQGPGRRKGRDRRSSAPTLAPLEGRRLMSADVAVAATSVPPDAPVQLFQAAGLDPAAMTVASTTSAPTPRSLNPTLSFEGDYVTRSARPIAAPVSLTLAPDASWLYQASDALVGPLGSGWAPGFAGGPVFDAATLPAFDGGPTTLPAQGGDLAAVSWMHDGPTTLPAYDAVTLPATDGDLAAVSWMHDGPTEPAPSASDADRQKLDDAFAKLHEDSQAIHDKSEVTPRLLATLRKAREKALDEAGEPDAGLVQALRETVQSVQDSGTFTDAQQAQLRADFTAVLQDAGVSDATTAELFAAQDAVRAASHVTADDLKTLADDRAAIQTLLDALPQEQPTILPAFDGGPIGQPGVVTTTALPVVTTTVDDAGGVTTTAVGGDVTVTSTPGADGGVVTVSARPGVGLNGLPAQFHRGAFDAIRQTPASFTRQAGALTRRMAARPGGFVRVEVGTSNGTPVAARRAAVGRVGGLGASIRPANGQIGAAAGRLRDPGTDATPPENA